MKEKNLEKISLRESIKIKDLKVPSEIGIRYVNSGKYHGGYEACMEDCGVDCGCGSEHGTPCPDW